ncbi:MAG: UvrB/UvrC motif-containing protein, partial [Prevotella sp.]|nr:UvrB/UvrC motif-containing protein [Prevotella sp.]
FAADSIEKSMSEEQLRKRIAQLTDLMKQAAKQLDFLQAAQYRDEIVRLQNLLDKK